MLNEIEKKYAKDLATKSIKYTLESADQMSHKDELKAILEISSDSVLTKNFGCFVTLKIDNELRGCIGSIVSDEPLYMNIISNAYNAAFRDPRFPPLANEEFENIEIEISVMGEIKPVPSLEDIVIGRDGLIVKRGYQQGLLLPQVATEWNFTREKFLEHTCIKAGLNTDAYKDEDVELYYFQAYVF